MKRLLSALLAAQLLLLAGCAAKPDTPDSSEFAEYYLTDADLPLDDAARLRAVPDFLTEEQQTLYRQAFALYSAMFDGETTGIDDSFPAGDVQTEYDTYTPDGSDFTYISSHSRWASWADFDRVVHALFTDALWSACNESGGAPIYIEHDGRLFILDCAYGDQYYNRNIPDEFTLTAQSDERIDFTVTAHYSYPYLRRDETEAERDRRLETSYEYTRTYPVALVYTGAGWRFDAFTTPNQADMQLLGAWDGISEDAFYASHTADGHGADAPAFFSDLGKTLSELKREHPDGAFLAKPDGFPDYATICFGDSEADFLYYFFGTQSGDAEKAMRECAEQLKCAGFLAAAGTLFPDMEGDMSFEAFFSLLGIDDYTYFSGEDTITAEGWLQFSYNGMEVMVNTNEATPGGGWEFTGEEIVRRDAPAAIENPEIVRANNDAANAVLFSEA